MEATFRLLACQSRISVGQHAGMLNRDPVYARQMEHRVEIRLSMQIDARGKMPERGGPAREWEFENRIYSRHVSSFHQAANAVWSNIVALPLSHFPRTQWSEECPGACLCDRRGDARRPPPSAEILVSSTKTS